jgi:predicted O-methyltransferase YrrM
MTSLTTAPIADVLERLFADAARTQAAFADRARSHPREAGKMDSREFFAAAKDVHLAVSRETGTLLYILARSHRARTVVEFGTSFGVSTICLAAAVQDNDGDIVIGTEYEPGKVAAARQAIKTAGLDGLVEIRQGDALQTLSLDLPSPIDMVFLDGAKDMYLDVLRLLQSQLAPGALVVADNASRSDGYVAHVRTCGDYLSIGVDNDVEISLATAPRSAVS